MGENHSYRLAFCLLAAIITVGAADRVSSGLLATIANPAVAANPQFEGSRFVLALAPTAVGALASPPFDDSSFDVAMPAPIDTSGGGGFSTIAGTVGDVYGGAATTGAPAAGEGSPVGFETVGKLLPPVGGVPGTWVLGILAALFFGSRWISRFVGRFVSIEE